ncbi:hypothetical protein K438DRAFT_348049 [Mycena galopus ATCC 62051]|nr:hypothetical protein K438DRAFT_348049 [Mycena galopus ATCC 62051]
MHDLKLLGPCRVIFLPSDPIRATRRSLRFVYHCGSPPSFTGSSHSGKSTIHASQRSTLREHIFWDLLMAIFVPCTTPERRSSCSGPVTVVKRYPSYL